MNDEGVTTYFEEINQMTHGASFLKTEIGYVPFLTTRASNLNIRHY